MVLAAINPDEITTTVGVWVIVALAVMAGITKLVGAVVSAYAEIRSQLATLKQGHDNTAARLDNTINAVETVKAEQLAVAKQLPAPVVAIPITQTTDTSGTNKEDCEGE